MTNRNRGVMAACGLAVIACALMCATAWGAAGEHASEPESEALGPGIRAALLGIAAAAAIGIAGLATAKVQAAVGAGATGAMAEKPELFRSLLILYAIPETIVVLGFVIAVMLLRLI